MKKLRFVATGLAFLLCCGATALAYDNDTHYVFTYFLARQVGFSPIHAHQIASADVSVDVDPNTEPVQSQTVKTVGGDPQTPRARFHAFRDSRLISDIIAVEEKNGASSAAARATANDYAEVAKQRQLEKLRSDGMKSGNIGMYLHALQDVRPHSPFDSYSGHVSEVHAPDYLSYNRANAVAMVADTVDALFRFMKDYLGKEARKPNNAEVNQVLDELIKANVWDQRGIQTVDEAAAVKVVESHLAGERVPAKTVYHFDKDGAPLDKDYALKRDASSMDEGWVIYVTDPGWLRVAKRADFDRPQMKSEELNAGLGGGALTKTPVQSGFAARNEALVALTSGLTGVKAAFFPAGKPREIVVGTFKGKEYSLDLESGVASLDYDLLAQFSILRDYGITPRMTFGRQWLVHIVEVSTYNGPQKRDTWIMSNEEPKDNSIALADGTGGYFHYRTNQAKGPYTSNYELAPVLKQLGLVSIKLWAEERYVNAETFVGAPKDHGEAH